jgi:DNA-binding winged helix-turn-helix (wHTH) protein/tetratricopeptide (TPR) repeat protein
LNDGAAEFEDGYLTTAELAGRDNFSLGKAIVSPSRRVISGPGGSTEVEPRVMQVLVVLADSANSVVTRHTLFRRCWGSSDVGDDSLNRAIAAVRKLGSDIGGGSFGVETIPRTGYRLTCEAWDEAVAGPSGQSQSYSPKINRRVAIGAAAGVVVAGATGTILWSNRQEDSRVHALISQAADTLDYGDNTLDPSKYLLEAVALDPRNSTAQGLLAFTLALNADYYADGPTDAIVSDAERAAKASLAIDPNDSNAKLAMILLRRTSLDLASTEDQFRQLLAAAPENNLVMRQLWNLLQSAGRSRDALALVQRAISLKPLAAANNFPLGQLLWIVGRTPEAERVLERAINYWPDHRFVRFARFNLLAYTGRARAALAMLDSKATAPQVYSAEAVAILRKLLAALIDPSPANRATARNATVEAIAKKPRLAAIAVLPLAALGEVDTAFQVANQLLVFDLPAEATAKRGQSSSLAWRFAPWLFTPPAASLRADPRFARLCDGTGLTAYWRKRGIKPDYLAFPD